MKIQGVHIFISIVILSVAAAIVAAFFMVGTPQEERARRMDAQRISELQQIANAIDIVWNETGALPVTLEELALRRNVYIQSIQDPETGVPYEYRPSKSAPYGLCATFSLPSSAQEREQPSYTEKPLNDRIWTHESGRKCFTLTPVVYPKM